MSLGSRKDAQPGQGAEGPFQPLPSPQTLGRWSLSITGSCQRGAVDGDLSPFALSLCCQGSKALRAQPRPFSVPVVAHATCRDSRSPPAPQQGEECWPSVVRWSEVAFFFISLVLSSGLVSMQ